MIRKRKTRRSNPADFGTAEIAKRFNVVPKLTDPNTYAGRVQDETEIDRMLVADRLTPDQHATLENFLKRLHRANFVGVKSPSFDGAVHADPSQVGDRRANQIRGIVGLFSLLDEKIGVKKRKALVNLVLLDTPWKWNDDELKETVEQLGRVMAS